MKRLKDFDEYSQGVPRYKPVTSLETGRVYGGTKYVRLEDFLAMQQTLENKVNEQTTLLEQVLKALRILVLLVTDVDADDEEDD